MPASRPVDAPLSATPELERLLTATRARLVRQVYAYGVGTVLGAASLWLAFAFLADWGLRVPLAVRILHGIVLFVVLGVFLWRDLLKPLGALPDREGLAVLFERAHPDLAQVLISAVQFQRRAPDGDAALAQATVRAAETRARTLASDAVVDPEAPRARLLLGLGGVLSLALAAAWNPLHARTFLERLFGGSTRWPQRTHLVLELPGLPDDAYLVRTPELLRLRLARGSDVPVLVTAENVAPEEVRLSFEGESDLVVPRSGARTYRTLLQSCQEDLAFHVTGGDDQDGLPRVEIQVLQPPDVAGLAFAITPPAYSGLAPSLSFDQEVEVLAGSELVIHIASEPPGLTGHVRLLPDDRQLALEPTPFPAAPAPEGSPAAPERPGLAFRWKAERTLGFRVELVDENGLTNPEPGLYRVRVVEDRVPELTVLAPARGEYETVAGGALPLRVRAEDDFGLARLGWRVRSSDGTRGSGEILREAELLPRREGVRIGRTARDAAVAAARLELDSLGAPGTPPPVDARFELEFTASDRRVEGAGEGRSSAVRLRVVTPEELLRRLQDRLAQARLDTLRLTEAQREKRTRLLELLDTLDGDGAAPGVENLALSAVLAGERRVLNDAQSLSRNLASAAEDVLYARLDDKAGGLLEFLDARLSAQIDERFAAGPWRELARECAAGRLASSGFAPTLVRLVELALQASEDHATAAVAALARAGEAGSPTDVGRALEEALAHTQRVEAALETLLDELSEWDNFQNVLTLARDILNRQKALRDRTQQFATENK